MYIKVFGRSIHLFHIALIVLALLGISYITKSSIESAYIAKNGIKVKGVITDILKAGSKGVEDYYYKFSYNGVVYSNSTIHLSKNIGDSVVVIFLKDKPIKNKLEESLLKTYGFFLRRNPNIQKAHL